MSSKDLRRHSSRINELELEVLRENITNKHKQLTKEIDEKLDKVFDDFLDQVNKLSLQQFEVEKLFNDGKKTTAGKRKDNAKRKLSDKLPEKVFTPRNSLLTDLFEIKHVNIIYRMFIVIFHLLLLNVFVVDFIDTGTINIGLRPIKSGFRGLHYAILIWFGMQVTTLCLYPVFKLWSGIVRRYSGGLVSFVNFIGVLGVIAYLSGFMYVFTVALCSFDLGQASSVAVVMELVRFLMKSYAFIRTNVPRVTNSKKVKSEDSESEGEQIPGNGSSAVNKKRIVPKFSQYLYFLFAPTLVYRDEYPRTKQIRWNFVLKNLLEVFGVIFLLSFISERFMYPLYNQFGSQFYEVGVKEFVMSICNAMLPGLLCFLCGFYCVLHSWMNGAAELLRFADRKFYDDWWNATNFSVYYRTWNTIVQDWLYLYVYRDLYAIFNGHKYFCQLLVFLLSAIFHEYVLGFAFRFCYPILFFQFQGASVTLFFLTRKDLKTFGNCFMWMTLAIGMGLNLSLFHMEYYARENCDFDRNDWRNYFIPISWSCNGLKSNDNWEIKLHF